MTAVLGPLSPSPTGPHQTMTGSTDSTTSDTEGSASFFDVMSKPRSPEHRNTAGSELLVAEQALPEAPEAATKPVPESSEEDQIADVLAAPEADLKRKPESDIAPDRRSMPIVSEGEMLAEDPVMASDTNHTKANGTDVQTSPATLQPQIAAEISPGSPIHQSAVQYDKSVQQVGSSSAMPQIKNAGQQTEAFAPRHVPPSANEPKLAAATPLKTAGLQTGLSQADGSKSATLLSSPPNAPALVEHWQTQPTASGPPTVSAERRAENRATYSALQASSTISSLLHTAHSQKPIEPDAKTRIAEPMPTIVETSSAGPTIHPPTTRQAAQVSYGAGAYMPPRPDAMIVSVSQSSSALEVTLKPEELGRLSLKLETTPHGTLVIVSADKIETQDLARRHVDMLEKQLLDMGMQDLSFAFSQEPGGGQGNDDAGTFEHAEPEAQLFVAKTSLNGSPTTGLDIKV